MAQGGITNKFAQYPTITYTLALPLARVILYFATFIARSCLAYFISCIPVFRNMQCKFQNPTKLPKNISCGYKISRQKFCRVMAGRASKSLVPPVASPTSHVCESATNQRESANHVNECESRDSLITINANHFSSLANHISRITSNDQ